MVVVYTFLSVILFFILVLSYLKFSEYLSKRDLNKLLENIWIKKLKKLKLEYKYTPFWLKDERGYLWDIHYVGDNYIKANMIDKYSTSVKEFRLKDLMGKCKFIRK